MIDYDELPAKQLTSDFWASVGLRNKVELGSLAPTVDYTMDPNASYYWVEAKASRNLFDWNIKPSDFGDFKLTATYGLPDVYIATSTQSASRAYVEEDLLADYRWLDGLDDAWLKVTYFQSLSQNWYKSFRFATDASVAVASPLHRVRLELQDWLDASVDDLADLLGLSPTTLINIAKPEWAVRPKTVRKMMSVHGLVRELQNAIGSHAALTWTRTVGRRLLESRRLTDFEQYVSTHIFPTAPSRRLNPNQFDFENDELDLKVTTPIGRPSRI